jgi:dienelactone hydrolase
MSRALTVALLLLLTAPAHAELPGQHQRYAVTRSGIEGMPDHTLFRPAGVPFKLPIVVWGNGGCRESNEEFRYFLTHLSSYGYLIVANGDPKRPYKPEELSGIADPKPERLIEGIDWAVKQPGVDPSRIAVLGQSCGGWETVDASSDKRVVTSIVFNSGTDAHNPSGVTQLHAPVLYAYGGTSDYVAADAVASYQVTMVPSVLAEHADAGHTGMFDDPAEPEKPPGPYQDEPLVVAANWLAFTLYGQPSGRDFFLGDACGLCRRSPWTVQSKNWDGYERKATQAPTCSKPARIRLGRRFAFARIYVDGRRVATLRTRAALRKGVRVRRPALVRIVGRSADGKRRVRIIHLDGGCP